MSVLLREEVEKLLASMETSRVERTISTTDTDKFCEAICAFANDMPDSRQSGCLLIGASDAGLMHYAEIQSAKNVLTKALSGHRRDKMSNILRVFDIVSANNDITLSAVSDMVSASRSAVNTYIDFMKGLGIVGREGGRFGGKWRIKAAPKVALGDAQQ